MVGGSQSFFDFNNFDYDIYSKKYPVSSVASFVPKPTKCDEAVWIEIERKAVSSSLVGPEELMKKWKNENLRGHNVMPYVESAHIGDIPMGHTRQSLLFENGVFSNISTITDGSCGNTTRWCSRVSAEQGVKQSRILRGI